MKSRHAFIAVLLAATFGLTACNTVAGFGRDVEKVGGKVEGAAEDCQAGYTC